MSISVGYRRCSQRNPSPKLSDDIGNLNYLQMLLTFRIFVAAYSIRDHEGLSIEMVGRVRSNMDNPGSNERGNPSAVSNQAIFSPSPSIDS